MMVSQSTIVVVDVVCQALCFVRVFLHRFDSYVRHAYNPWDSRFDSIRFDTDSSERNYGRSFSQQHIFFLSRLFYISMNQRTKFPFHYAAIAARDVNDDNNALDETKQMVSIARAFLFRACPTHHLMAALDDLNSDQRSSEDRLVKIGRNVCSTLKVARRNAHLALSREEKDKAVPLADASLSLLVDECTNLAAILSGTETRKVPKKRFGKTELQMPVLSLGCMRFQQSWNRGKEVVLDLTSVEAECQKNLVEIIKHAVRCGVTHIETAQMYGTSEMQIGPALRTLFDSGFVKREDLIIQTKGALSSSMTPADYKKQILDSLELLQLDYVDLISVHGVNMDCDYEWLFHSNSSNDKGNLISTLHELKAEGKIRHIGFSTHGRAELIRKFIDSDAFEYCNIHYHFCGSYTASGDAEFGGNLSNIRLAHEKDMGVFIISAYDKVCGAVVVGVVVVVAAVARSF